MLECCKLHLKKNKGKSVYTVKKEDQIKAEIQKNGPVQTAFTVYEDFVRVLFKYISNIYVDITLLL